MVSRMSEKWVVIKQDIGGEGHKILVSSDLWNGAKYPFVIFMNNPSQDDWNEFWNIIGAVIDVGIWYCYEDEMNKGLELTEEEYEQIKHLLKMVGYDILHIEVYEKENEFFPASFYIENKRRKLGKCQ